MRRLLVFISQQPFHQLSGWLAWQSLAKVKLPWRLNASQSVLRAVLDRWNTRRSTAVPPGLIGRIAPTRTEGINLRGVFTFPIEQYQAQLLP